MKINVDEFDRKYYEYISENGYKEFAILKAKKAYNDAFNEEPTEEMKQIDSDIATFPCGYKLCRIINGRLYPYTYADSVYDFMKNCYKEEMKDKEFAKLVKSISKIRKYDTCNASYIATRKLLGIETRLI